MAPWRSSTITSQPACANSRATASPITPPPTTTASTDSIMFLYHRPMHGPAGQYHERLILAQIYLARQVLQKIRFLQAVHYRAFDFGQMKLNTCSLQPIIYGFQAFQ